MVAYSCNIQCNGCISLSNFKRDGIASLEDITCWISHWSQHLDPQVISIFGGEPMLHPQIEEVCLVIRQTWAKSRLRFITNGYLLDRVRPEFWYDLGDFEMQVSVHRQDHLPLINKQIKKILSIKKDWKMLNPQLKTKRHEQMTFVRPDMKIYKSVFKDFIAPYRLENGIVQPFHSDPTIAHSICGSPDSPILYKGKLYKCPAVANAIEISQANWYDYKACEDNSTLNAFVDTIGKPEPVCAQCPDKSNLHCYDHMDPKNVIVKIKDISKRLRDNV